MSDPALPAFFVVGTGRSGTTLARAILTGHRDIEIPGETGFLPRLLRLQPLWWGRGGLRSRVFVRLCFANGRLARSGLEPDQLRSSLANTEPTSPSDAIGAVYRTYGDRKPARIVGDKTPGYVDHLRLLAERFPTATFIQMVRHPLDVVGTMTDQPWAPDNQAACALIWKQSQRRAARSGVGPDRRLVVRLEDLVGDADATVARICAHLGVQVEPAMFDFQGRAVDISAQNIHPQSHARLGRSLGRTRDWRRPSRRTTLLRPGASSGAKPRRWATRDRRRRQSPRPGCGPGCSPSTRVDRSAACAPW